MIHHRSGVQHKEYGSTGKCGGIDQRCLDHDVQVHKEGSVHDGVVEGRQEDDRNEKVLAPVGVVVPLYLVADRRVLTLQWTQVPLGDRTQLDQPSGCVVGLSDTVLKGKSQIDWVINTVKPFKMGVP